MTPPTSTDVVWLLPIGGDDTTDPRRQYPPDVGSENSGVRRDQSGAVLLEASDYMSASATRKGAGGTAPDQSSELRRREAAGGARGGDDQMRFTAAALSDLEPSISGCWFGG